MSFPLAAAAAAMALTTGLGPAAWPEVVVHELFRPAAGSGDPARGAVTYDQKWIPAHAAVSVRQHHAGEDGTRVTLRLSGVRPGHRFGAHVHTGRCGPRPDDSGPHYQHRRDPRQPSTDPEYANPENEVWLDLTTDRRGSGHAATAVDWRFRPGAARSVVVHEHATRTDEGHAGQAGARLACVNVPFTG